AKASPDDLLIRITVSNRGPEAAPLDLLPTLWFRNTWAWGRSGESYWPRPAIQLGPDGTIETRHVTLGAHRLAAAPDGAGSAPRWLFTENETNAQRLFEAPNWTPHVKDAFHDVVVHGRAEAASDGPGTKAAAWYRLEVPAGATRVIRLRLTATDEASRDPF